MSSTTVTRFRPLAWIGIAFLGFYLLYQLSLAISSTAIPEYPDWSYFADNREAIYQSREHPGVRFSIAKHPLFYVVGRLLYLVGSQLFKFVSGDIGSNLRVVFPMAVVGALGACINLLLFRRAHGNRFVATAFGLLFALSTSAWVFSSFPDSYPLTALATSLFFAALLLPQEEVRSVYAVALANAIAGYASPQQAMLGVIPCLYYLQTGGFSRSALLKVARYGAALLILFLIPYLAFLELIGYGAGMPADYVEYQAEFDSRYFAVVPLNLLVFSIIGPAVHGDLFASLDFAGLGAAPWWWWLLLLAFAAFVVGCLGGLRGSTSAFRPYVPGIVVFLAVYVVFFVFFNPSECYLMSLPMLPALLLVLHAGAAGQDARAWRVFLALFVAGAIANSGAVIAFLHTLM